MARLVLVVLAISLVCVGCAALTDWWGSTNDAGLTPEQQLIDAANEAASGNWAGAARILGSVGAGLVLTLLGIRKFRKPVEPPAPPPEKELIP